MPRLSLVAAWALILLAANPCLPIIAAEEADARIPGIGPVGPLVEIKGEFKFTEGPAADAKGTVFFTDVPQAKVFKIVADDAELFRDNTNHVNGQMFNAAGELVSCESRSGRLVAVSADGKQVRVLADKFQGQRFRAPNDLVVDRTGGVYFTDPHIGMQVPPNESTLYYVSSGGEVKPLAAHCRMPNGVILSPDETTLYVIPTGQAEMMAFHVESPGQIDAGRTFSKLAQKEGYTSGGGDGCTVDARGNLYITSVLGIQVFDPQGKPLGVLKLPKNPSNCTFGGSDMKTLYVTARTSVYALPMEATGHRFPGGEK